MNFFEYQEKARNGTTALVILFSLAVCTFVVVLHFALAGIYWFGSKGQFGDILGISALWIPFMVLCIILIATIYKIHRLKQGGGYIAQMLGGRRIDPDSRDLSERRLLNIVEEMAIASGIPVPPVYVLAGQGGINAFAAGYEPADAVIAVTEGSLRLLSRDELQGVIAHEFSHIFNGDMRLNIRTIGVLNGIIVFIVIGRILASTSGNSRKNPFIPLAITLMIVGSIGLFFSKIIKFAISRQREYLADASAVQFTRNPMALAGALKKIGGLPEGSVVRNPHAEELSHLFFANGVSGWFNRLFSTHPPLATRISRLDPAFDGRFSQTATGRDIAAEEESAMITGLSGYTGTADGMPVGDIPVPLDPASVTSAVGAPGHEHLLFAQKIFADLPAELLDRARRTDSAPLIIYCLLLSSEKEVFDKQIQRIGGTLAQAGKTMDDLQSTRALLDTVGRSCRLPLAGVAIPALTKMTAEEFRLFRDTLSYLVEVDGNITLFEYALQRMVIRHIGAALSPRRRRSSYYASIKPVMPSYRALASILAYYGTPDLEKAAFAFEMAKLRLGIKEPLAMLPREQANMSGLDGSLNILANASPPIRKQVLEACTACITTDGCVNIEEAELLRLIADSRDCPVPPILPTSVE